MDKIQEILSGFPAISLEEMNEVRLMNRADLKYIFHINKLEGVLESALGSFKLLTINGLGILRYSTLYFDIPNLSMYHEHHNGVRSRYKVRFREYVDTGMVFLEIKEKNNRDKTRKERMPVKQMETVLSEQSVRFIETYTKLDAAKLQPVLRTEFSRITLVNEIDCQRITIDMNISFDNTKGKKEIPYLVICEMKLDRWVGQNIFTGILRSYGIHPQKMSKYGIGTAMLNPDIKQNRFKEKIITLNKLKNDHGSYQAAV